MNLDNRWLMTAAIAVLAAAGGFGIARWTAPPPAAVESPAPSGPVKLTLDDKEIAAAGILVEAAGAGNLGTQVLAPAVTAAQPNGVAALMAHAEGVISRLNKRLGDPVEAGEVLALVDSKDAAQIASDRQGPLRGPNSPAASWRRRKRFSRKARHPNDRWKRRRRVWRRPRLMPGGRAMPPSPPIFPPMAIPWP